MKRIRVFVLVLTSVWLIESIAHAAIILPNIIGDHMILQQGMDAPIWGKAAPGEKISVQGDWQLEPVKTTADREGHWLVKLHTPLPGGPHAVTIRGDSDKIVLRDVLIGEVWVCSGQSNMEFPVGYAYGGYSGATNWQHELQHADIPGIRLFTVENSFALAPQSDCHGSWSLCDSNTARAFSAVAFFFGRELHENLKVPIGLVDADFGGTVCEAWTSSDRLTNFPDFTEGLQAVKMEITHSNEMAQATAKKTAKWAAQIESAGALKAMAAPGYDDSSWSVTQNLGDDQSHLGFILFRKTVNLPHDWENRDLVLELGPVDDMDFTFFNGVKIGQTVGGNKWDLPRVYPVSKSLLKSGANFLTVCALNTGGPGGISGPARLHPVGDANSLSLDHDWRFQNGIAYASLPELVLPQDVNANSPSVLFNAMIAPLIPFGIRGAIWYQGESNIGRAGQYRRLFPAMIGDWRRHWGEGDFPFYFVQIAPFHYPNAGLSSALREAQAYALRTPNTGMAVTMDSDSNNLHPRNKQPVGHRLALWALAKTYGWTNLVYSGPIYRSMKVEGGKVRLFFDHVGSGLTCYGGAPGHFIIAGDDEKFVPAQAEIEGDTIVVSSAAVPHPAAVRYAWDDGDEASFGNREGLPAPLFRTDAPAGQ